MKNKLLTIISLLLISLTFITFVKAECIGINYTGTSDWIINETTTCSDINITLNHNLTVNNSANLIFNNVTLNLSLIFNGSIGIDVKNGSSMFVYNSTLQSNSSYNYYWIVNGSFLMDKTQVSQCGYSTGGTGKLGITLYHNNSLINNSIIKNSLVGTHLLADNNRIINSKFLNVTYGIYVGTTATPSNSNYLTNITIQNATTYGINLNSGSNNNVLEDIKIIESNNIFISNCNHTLIRYSLINISTNTKGVYTAINSKNVTIVDSIILNNGTNNSIEATLNSDFYLVNTTINKTLINITGTGNVSFQHYVQFNVSNSVGVPVGGVNVSLWNRSHLVNYFNLTTLGNGLTSQVVVTESVAKAGFNGVDWNVSYNPYNITFNKTGYNVSHVLFDIDHSGIYNFTMVQLDTTPPNFTLIYPPNNTVSYMTQRTIMYNVTDDSNITNCSLYVNGLINQTDTSINKTGSNYFSLDFSGTNANINWHINCTDEYDNYNTTQIRSYTYNYASPYPVSTCMNLNESGRNYTLTNHVNSTGTCFNITANNISLDCQGFMINYSTNDGASLLGIIAINKKNITIKNCRIYEGVLGTFAGRYGIRFNNISQGLVINNTIITQSSNNGNGIAIFNSNNISIAQNKINTSQTGNTAYGVYLGTTRDITIRDNIINTFTQYSDGITLYTNDNNTHIYDNNITTFTTSTLANGVTISASSNNNISRNNIKVYGSADGIYIETESKNNVLIGNNINVSTGLNSYGIDITSSSDNTTIDHNTITTNGTGGYGIYISTSINCTTHSNNITTFGSTAHGIFLSYSDNNKLNNDKIITQQSNSEGIRVIGLNNEFNNTQIYSNYVGIYMVNPSLDNTFRNITVNSPNYNLQIASNQVHRTYIIDSILDSYYTANPGVLLYFKNSAFGDLKFTSNVGESGNHLFDNNETSIINISNNSIKINPVFNAAANLTFFNSNSFGITNKIPYINGAPCSSGVCQNIISGDTYHFSVTGAGNYSVGEANNSLVTGCSNLNVSGDYYTLANNVTSTNTCFNISADNITLDCQGFSVNYSTDGGGNEYGVYVYEVKNVTVKNCDISEINNLSSNSYPIFLLKVNGSLIINNSLRAFGSFDYGLRMYNSSNNQINNNRIITNGSTGHGIVVDVSWDNTITNNSISTSGIGAHGVYFYYANKSNIMTNNMILINGTDSFGVAFFNTNNTHLQHNNITTNSTNGNGLYFYASNHNTINNQAITTFGAFSRSIYFDMPSDNNTFTGLNIKTHASDANAIFLDSNNTNFLIKDSIFNVSESGTEDFYLTAYSSNGSWNFVNVTNEQDVGINVNWQSGLNSTLKMYWYLDIKVTNQTGGDIENAEVELRDKDNQQVFNATTDIFGIVDKKTILAYTQTNESSINYSSPYRINVNKTGYYPYNNQTITLTNNLILNIELVNYDFNFTHFNVTPGSDTVYNVSRVYNFTANLTGANGTVYLNFNGTNHLAINSSEVYHVNLTGLRAGNYTYYWWGFDNGTTPSLHNSSVFNYTILKATPVLSFNNSVWSINYSEQANISGICPSQLNCTLYRNGINISNPDQSILAATSYIYVFNTSGNENYTNASITEMLTIYPIMPSLNYYLNGLPNNVSVIYPGTINATATTNGGVLRIYRNGTEIIKGFNYTLAAGSYKFEFNVTSNENYTEAYAYLFANVNKTNIFGRIINNSNITLNYGEYFNYTINRTNIGADDLIFNVFRNITDVTSEEGQNILLTAEDYVYTLNTSGGQNYSANKSLHQIYVTVNKAAGSVILMLNRTSANFVAPTGSFVEFNASTAYPQLLTLYDDGLFPDNYSYSATSSFIVSKQYNKSGVYLISLNASGNENYTESNASYYLTINPTPPGIDLTNVTVRNDSATINWTTDEGADSRVNYGLTESFGLTANNSVLVTSHSMTLTGLVNNTLYYFQIISCDEYADCNMTVTHNFTTENNPDYQAPDIIVNSPLNQTYNTTLVLINLSSLASDIGSLWFFNTTDNETYASSKNLILSDGQHTLFFYANDTSGNMNKTNVSFSVDTTPPIINLSQPANTETITLSPIVVFGYYVNESSQIINCALLVNNTAYFNTSAISTSAQNYFSQTLTNGDYYWNISCYDSNNFVGTSETRNFTMNYTVAVAPPTCSDGIKNQDETSIDCGGNTCSACAVTGGGGGSFAPPPTPPQDITPVVEETPPQVVEEPKSTAPPINEGSVQEPPLLNEPTPNEPVPDNTHFIQVESLVSQKRSVKTAEFDKGLFNSVSSTIVVVKNYSIEGNDTKISYAIKNIGIINHDWVALIIDVPKEVAMNTSSFTGDFYVLQEDPQIMFYHINVTKNQERESYFLIKNKQLTKEAVLSLNHTIKLNISQEEVNLLQKKANDTSQVIGVTKEVLVFDNKTDITITLHPQKETENVTVYLEIPKCLAETLKDIEFEIKDYEVIQDDPLVAFNFVSVDAKTDIKFEVLKSVDPDCWEQVKTLPIAEKIKDRIIVKDNKKLYLALILFLLVNLFALGFNYFQKKAQADENKKSIWHKIEFGIIETLLVLIIAFNIFEFLNLLTPTFEFIAKVMSITVLTMLLFEINLEHVFYGRKARFEMVTLLVANFLIMINLFLDWIFVAYEGIIETRTETYVKYLYQLVVEFEQTHPGLIANTSMITGFIILLLLAFRDVFKEVQGPSLFEALHMNGKAATLTQKIERFFVAIIVYLAFYIIFFNFFIEWLAIGIDSTITIFAVLIYGARFVIKHYKHYHEDHVINKIGSVGEDIYTAFINLFRYRFTILFGLTGILVLHLVVDVANYIIPFVLNLSNELYFSQINTPHLTLIAILAELYTDNLLINIGITINYVLNIIFIVTCLLFPVYLWYDIYKNHVIDIPRVWLGVFFGSMINYLINPLISVGSIHSGSVLGVDMVFKTSLVNNPLDVLWVSMVIGAFVYVVADKAYSRIIVKSLFAFAVLVFFFRYVYLYVQSWTLTLFPEITSLFSHHLFNSIMIGIMLSLFLGIILLFYVSSFFYFVKITFEEWIVKKYVTMHLHEKYDEVIKKYCKDNDEKSRMMQIIRIVEGLRRQGISDLEIEEKLYETGVDEHIIKAVIYL